MSEQLNAIPPVRRRRMALGLAPLGAVLLVAGILACSLPGLGWKLVGLPVGLLGLVLVGVAWGLRRSAALTEAALAEQRLDDVLAAAAVAAGASCAPAGSGGAGCAPAAPGGVGRPPAAPGGVGRPPTGPGDAGRPPTGPGDAGGTAADRGAAVCGSTGLACHSGSATVGCGASCLARSG